MRVYELRRTRLKKLGCRVEAQEESVHVVIIFSSQSKLESDSLKLLSKCYLRHRDRHLMTHTVLPRFGHGMVMIFVEAETVISFTYLRNRSRGPLS